MLLSSLASRVVDRPKTSRHRVLSVIRWPLGGIRTYVLYLYPALVDAGYRFTFVGPAHPVFRDFGKEVGHWPGTEFEEAPHKDKDCDLRVTVRRLLRSGRFDLVHSHGLSAAAQVALANAGVGVPHVTTSHDVFRPNQFPGLVGRLKRWGLGQLLGWTDGIVSVSHDAQDNLLEYLPGLARGRTRLVPVRNGINTAQFADAAEAGEGDLRRRLGIGPDVFLMGFLGRFMEQKGFLPLLGALQRLRRAGPPGPFHLAAVGSGDYLREYQSEVERRGLADCVTFLPFVPDVGPTLRQLDLLVMPSLWEACAILPMEAMAVGVPVLGSSCVGLREVLRDTPSLTVPPGDEAALAEGLARAMAAPWKEQARAFAPLARERYDADRAAEGLRQVFEDVLATRRTRR
ncbi:MAG TPA: glycosyltransferase family 4 protein [Gemmataceae bacterium]|nr:glycosyltransferase family 4 protein [Gemmataceae bacterium]